MRIKDPKRRIAVAYAAMHPRAVSTRGDVSWFRREMEAHGCDIGLRTLYRWLEHGVPEHGRVAFEAAIQAQVEAGVERLRKEMVLLSSVLP